MHEPEEILRELDRSYRDLRAALDKMSPAQKVEPGAAGRWRVKDVLSHLARWNDVAYEEVTTLARGERTGKDYRNYLAINDEWEKHDWDRPLAEAEQHFETAHARLAGWLHELPPDQWTRSIRRWAWIAIPEHYDEHLGYIRAWQAESLKAGQ